MIGNLIGGLGKMAVVIFNICMLPLAIYALMVHQGWDWMKAGVAALIVAFIPVFGSLALFALAIAGLYYLFI